jgi:beta-lactam-binding protein with PASTA domain
VTVPNLFGLAKSEAELLIQNSGLAVGAISYFRQADLPPGVDITVVDVGEVLIQAPGAGAQVPRGTLVSIGVRSE